MTKTVLFCFFSLLHHLARRILVPQPGIKPEPLALEAPNLNHWTAREVPQMTKTFKFQGRFPRRGRAGWEEKHLARWIEGLGTGSAAESPWGTAETGCDCTCGRQIGECPQVWVINLAFSVQKYVQVKGLWGVFQAVFAKQNHFPDKTAPEMQMNTEELGG